MYQLERVDKIHSFLFIIALIRHKISIWTINPLSSNLVVARSTRAGGAIFLYPEVTFMTFYRLELVSTDSVWKYHISRIQETLLVTAVTSEEQHPSSMPKQEVAIFEENKIS